MAAVDPVAAILAGSPPATWLFVGDSITQGSKHTEGARSFPQLFEEWVRYERGRRDDIVVTTAFSGETTDDLLASFAVRVARPAPDVVFVMFGTNDATGLVSEPRFRANLERIVAQVRALDALPVLQTPNPIAESGARGAALAEYVRTIRAVAADEGVALVDHYRDGEPDPALLADAIHPNALGHRTMAERVIGYVATVS